MIGVRSTQTFGCAIAAAAGLLASALAPCARAATPAASTGEMAAFKPSWLGNYEVWSPKADLSVPNHSYLENRNTHLVDDPLLDQFDSLMTAKRAAEWRQQYDDMNRDYDQRARAGLNNPTVEQAHEGAVSGFSNGVRDEIENKKIGQVSDKATQVAEKEEAVVQHDRIGQVAMVPGAVAVGVYMGIWVGKPINLRVNDDTHFSFRTSLRNRLGAVELHSPILFSSFEFHQQAPDNYALIAPTNVDFGEVMNFAHIVDFQDEKYQFKVARTVPFIDLSSSVFYGSSSNVVASSLTKQLTPHLAAVVDSIYYLTPYDPDHSIEERIRLKYDIHF
jgi:hypothetical protein